MNGPALPVNICSHPDGFLVRVQRQGVELRAFVPRGHADPLAEALRQRDRFYRIAGAVEARRGPRTRSRSNTGIPGISETQTWRHGQPYPNLCVSWSDVGVHHTARVYFGHGRSRSEAMRCAIELRREKAGAVITAQQEEVACG
jgi:hypothetical protein